MLVRRACHSTASIMKFISLTRAASPQLSCAPSSVDLYTERHLLRLESTDAYSTVPVLAAVLLLVETSTNRPSFRKLILWWALVFLSMSWIVFYINTITKNSAAVLSPPLNLFALLSAATFLLLLVLFWRHNQSAYKRRYSQWER